MVSLNASLHILTNTINMENFISCRKKQSSHGNGMGIKNNLISGMRNAELLMVALVYAYVRIRMI